jgi:uncharacterized protein YndB with AHSA1/START domain
MALSFTVSDVIPAGKEAVYNAWLDSEKHAKMTNSASATGSLEVGGSFMAHDGYIKGKNIELDPYFKIIQSWRSAEFKDGEEDSQITVTFEDTAGGSLVTLTHSNVPEGGEHYESGWRSHYFEPMKKYFAGRY